ncbi:MAG: hypothetical protein ACPGLV_01310 [Bacteroidia bacterium]
MKKHLEIIFFVMVSAGVLAASPNDTLHWQWNKKLSWSDFKAKPSAYKKLQWNAETKYIAWDMSSSDQYLNPRVNVVVYFNREASWIRDAQKTDYNLLKIQNKFDLFELGARRARFMLDSVVKSGGKYYYEDAEVYITKAFDWYDRKIDRMYADYRNSTIKDAGAKWERKVDSLLSIYYEYNRFVKEKTGKIGFDFTLETGPSFWLNRNAEHVQNLAAIRGQTSYGILYKEFSFGLQIGICNNWAYPELKHRLNFDIGDPDQLAVRDVHLYLAKRLVDGNKVSFSASIMGGRAGVGSVNITTETTWSYGAGIMADYHFQKYKNANAEINLRFKLEYTAADFTYFYQQRLINFTIGLGMYGHGTRYKRPQTPIKFR